MGYRTGLVLWRSNRGVFVWLGAAGDRERTVTYSEKRSRDGAIRKMCQAAKGLAPIYGAWSGAVFLFDA